MWSWEEETSRSLQDCLLVAGLVTTPMPSSEDFGFGKKPGDTVARRPGRGVLIATSRLRVPRAHKIPGRAATAATTPSSGGLSKYWVLFLKFPSWNAGERERKSNWNGENC